MRFRGGNESPIEAGSWIVNCTGYIGRRDHSYEPYLSDQGTVLSIQPYSSIHLLSSVAAYFLTHLFYLGKLERLPLIELNGPALREADKALFPFAVMTHSIHNVVTITSAAPLSVLRDCGLDTDRWYPLPRRLLNGRKAQRNQAAYLSRFRETLAKIESRYGTTCGVLPSVQRRLTQA